MPQPRTNNRVLLRLLLVLLPTSIVPLIVFGVVAIRGHYESLRKRAQADNWALAQLMSAQLEREVARTRHDLEMHGAAIAAAGDDTARIAQILADWRNESSEILSALLLDADNGVVASDPAGSNLAAGRLLESVDGEPGSLTVTAVMQSSVEIEYSMMLRIASPHGPRGLVIDVSLVPWMQTVQAGLKGRREITLALLPTTPIGQPVNVSLATKREFYVRAFALTRQVTGSAEFDIDGVAHHVTSVPLLGVLDRLVLAQPASEVYSAARAALVTFIFVTVTLLAALIALFVMIARDLSARVLEIEDAASQVAAGHFDVRVARESSDEVGQLASTFNRMTSTLQASHGRMRTLYRSLMELFGCNELDALVCKGTELTCTQCGGDMAWFVPATPGRLIAYSGDSVFLGLHAWVWRNHRTVEIDAGEAPNLWRREAGDQIFSFRLKSQAGEAGTLNVAYRKAPDEGTVSLLHAVVSLLEGAIQKQDSIRKEAVITTELEMAEAVQRSVMKDNVLVSRAARIAYHYEPATRLGGDWFYVVEDASHDRVFVIMGDVTGQGLSQGLVTTAVKGALDVVEHLAKLPEGGAVCRPATIVSLLETVVRRVANSHDLNMTCLVAEVDFARLELRVCNAGHTFPILLRAENGLNTPSHLHKNQQPMLGFGGERDGTHVYGEAVYPLRAGDFLVVYTDGLTEVRNLKSRIFGRFLFRSLRKAKTYDSAEELKDEILAMFRYYTQGHRIEDDVCFLVVQIADAPGALQLSS